MDFDDRDDHVFSWSFTYFFEACCLTDAVPAIAFWRLFPSSPFGPVGSHWEVAVVVRGYPGYLPGVAALGKDLREN